MHIGFGLTGSFCTLAAALDTMRRLTARGHTLQPVASYHVDQLDTRFFARDELYARIAGITPLPVWNTIPQAETAGPADCFDAMIIAPCTGNTLAKLVRGITDTPTLMAAKATLRNGKPLVLAVCTNDGLAINAQNIGRACALRNVYLVPMRQDDAAKKPTSLVADMGQVVAALDVAMAGLQLQPILV